MTFSANSAYRAQLDLIREEGENFAKTVAAHIENDGPAGEATLEAFLASLPLSDGGRVTVDDDREARSTPFRPRPCRWNRWPSRCAGARPGPGPFT